MIAALVLLCYVSTTRAIPGDKGAETRPEPDRRCTSAELKAYVSCLVAAGVDLSLDSGPPKTKAACACNVDCEDDMGLMTRARAACSDSVATDPMLAHTKNSSSASVTASKAGGCGNRSVIIDLTTQSAHAELAKALQAARKPIIVKGLKQALEWPSLKWSFTSLAKSSAGRLRVKLRHIDEPIYSQFSHAAIPDAAILAANAESSRYDEETALSDYLKRVHVNTTWTQLFAIGEEQMAGLSDLGREAFPLPGFLGKYRRDGWNAILSIGQANSGVSWHTHDLAWLATISGTKRWFLYPPNAVPGVIDRQFIGKPALWAERVHQNCSSSDPMKLRCPIVCDVSHGEAVIVPFGWWHATSNVGDTIAVGHQLSIKAAPTAVKDMKRMEKKWKDTPHAEMGLALLEMEKSPEQAIKRARRAVKLNPYNFQQRLQLMVFSLRYAVMQQERNIKPVLQELADTKQTLTSLWKDGLISKGECVFVLRFMAAVLFETPARQQKSLVDFLKHAAALLEYARETYASAQDLGLLEHLSKVVCADVSAKPAARKCIQLLRDILAVEPNRPNVAAKLQFILSSLQPDL